MNLNFKGIVLSLSCFVLTGCIDDSTSIEDLSSAPKAASFSIEVNEDESIEFSLQVTDRESNIKEYFLEEAPENGIITGQYPDLIYTPNADFNGRDEFKYKVTDGSFDSNISTVTIQINPINDSPIITDTTSSKTIIANTEFVFTPITRDIDSASLSFTIENLPEWASFNQSNGMIYGTPNNNQDGFYSDIIISVSDGHTLVSFKEFDLLVEQNPWLAISPLLQATSDNSRASDASSAVHNNKIYVFGGSRNNRRVQMYDTTTNQWSIKNNMPIGMSTSSAHTINDKIYVFGGWGDIADGYVLNTLLEYDPLSDQWHEKTSRPTRRGNFATQLVDGKIYLFGGYGAADDGVASGLWTPTGKSHLEIYNPNTDSWTTGSAMPEPIIAPASCKTENNIYVFGGRHVTPHFQPVSTTYAYNIDLDEWTTKSPSPISRSDHRCVSDGTSLYLLGGRSGDIVLDDISIYSSSIDSWEIAPDLPVGRVSFTTDLIDRKIYVSGGTGNNGPLVSSGYLNLSIFNK